MIGEKGSALHLSLFSTSVKKMIIILNPNESENGLPLLQSEICALKNVDCSFIVGNELAERKGYTVSIDSVVDIN